MTRVFLAAGVAALAISAPASAGPHGNKADRTATAKQGGGQRPQARAERPARVERQQARAQRPARAERQQARAERPARVERQQARAERPARVERKQVRAERPARVESQQARAERPARVERQQVRVERQQGRADRVQQVQNRKVDRQQVRMQRVEQAQNRALDRQQIRNERIDNRLANRNAGYGVGGCPPGLAKKAVACVPPGIAARALTADRLVNADAFRESRLAGLTTRFLPPAQAVRYVGQPLGSLSNAITLAALPSGVSYLYPDTPDYYYRYGDGYLYQVDRSSSIISALLPLLAGGYMPGTYLPNQYMNSYAPSSWGLNSFYPSSYDYGYGYGSNYGYGNYGYGGSQNLCNRYANGVIYRVDCMNGMIVDVVPTYAGGYGVGQLLPSSYSTYNVPYQYRSMYYDTPDYNYWYAPGAIYQYDPQSSLITSVAALLSPGFTVGQQLPVGYNTYNVPYAYRTTYYDTPNAWYRYNNGNIYQIDPTTQLVSAIVASILT